MNDPLFLFDFSTTLLELVSFILSVITVLLNIRQTHWAWLFSIASSATYGVVFYGARIYGDAALQGVFIAVSVWGWYQWLHGSAQHDALKVTRCGRAGWAAGLLGWAVGFVVLAWFLQTYTQTDVPRIDGFLTAGSLLGQLLLSRKKLENWIVWVAVDVLYVGLYVHKGLMLTAVLYGVFVIMALMGWRAWARIADRRA